MKVSGRFVYHVKIQGIDKIMEEGVSFKRLYVIFREKSIFMKIMGLNHIFYAAAELS